MQKFCPRCGKEVEKVFGPRGLCSDCYSETAEFVELPDEITFDQCSVCRSYKVENTWNEFESDEKLVFDLLKPFEKEEVEMSAAFNREGEKYVVQVFMEKEENGEIVKQASEVVMRPEKTQCFKCSRYSGGYFEAILQLRGKVTDEMLGQLMDTAAEMTNKDRNDFISNVEEIHGGYDIYASSLKMVDRLVQQLEERFEVEEKRSRELVGEKDGEEVYRTVVSARVTGLKSQS